MVLVPEPLALLSKSREYKIWHLNLLRKWRPGGRFTTETLMSSKIIEIQSPSVDEVNLTGNCLLLANRECPKLKHRRFGPRRGEAFSSVYCCYRSVQLLLHRNA